MELSLGQIRAATGAEFDNPAALATPISGWSIDSRSSASGDLFFALSGENFNGHDFVPAALTNGAAAALVSQPVAAQGNVLNVGDTLLALQQLAKWAREHWGKPVVAITGSAGKTSTKDIVAALLSVRMRVGKTTGNFNNHIGLPLSILRIPDDAQVAVLEMGMNHAGEIRDLCRIANPDIGVVTNIGYAHVENFDSIEGIAAAKRELIDALPLSGTAILNADDPRAGKFAHAGRSITYGLCEEAEVRAEEVALTPAGSEFTVAGVRFHSQLIGRHGISNVLAGIAVAKVFGIAPAALVEAVAALTPGKMRGERYVWNGVTVLNDAYNSNPEAVQHMLDVLRNEQSLRRIAVLGEMRELGAMSERLHSQVGAYASGIDLLIGIRGAARAMVEAAPGVALFFETPQAAGEYLRTFVKPGDAILFKGSRGTQVERAIATMEAMY
jgi:UDP-N-acetylmuramoyl-tripeptide--D-alanyl-D-alanine ligase